MQRAAHRFPSARAVSAHQPWPASPCPPPPSFARHAMVCCFQPSRLSRCVVARARDSPLCHSESPPVLQEHRLSPALRAAGEGGPALAELRSCVPRISLPDEAEAYSWGCWGSAQLTSFTQLSGGCPLRPGHHPVPPGMATRSHGTGPLPPPCPSLRPWSLLPAWL